METQNDILSFILNHSLSAIMERIDGIHPADFLEALHTFEEDPLIILEKLPNHYIALLLDQAEDDEKFALLSLFPDKRKKHIMAEMSSDELVDLLGNLDEEEKEEIILHLDSKDAQEVKELLAYPPDSAGGIMATEFIAVKEMMTVDEMLRYVRGMAPASETPYYLYVLDEQRILKGVVPLRDLIIAEPHTLIQTLMIKKVVTIPVEMDQEEVGNLFEKYGFMVMPVVDANGVMLGIVTVDDVMEVMREEQTEDMFRLAGLDEEEKISGSVASGIKSRLPWLLVNLVTAILAAATVSLFETTIVKIVALATFMPIVAGMGGNAGTQTLTMIIRGIALGELTFENQKEILKKEFAIGMINGICLGFVVATLGYYWVGNAVFGFVIGTAMLLNMVIATIAGFFIPVLLKKIGIDPALASAVFVTTVTDVLGFFFFLGLATVFLRFLA